MARLKASLAHTMLFLNTDTLRAMNTQIIAHIEALRADDIRPSSGAVAAMNEIHAELTRREA